MVYILYIDQDANGYARGINKSIGSLGFVLSVFVFVLLLHPGIRLGCYNAQHWLSIIAVQTYAYFD